MDTYSAPGNDENAIAFEDALRDAAVGLKADARRWAGQSTRAAAAAVTFD